MLSPAQRPSRVELVVFDLAGTLVDCGSCAPVAAFARVFAERGVELTVEEIRAFMGTGKHDHIAALCALPRVAQAWRAANGSEPGEREVDVLYEAFLPVQRAAASEASQLVPGAREGLEQLARAGVPFAVTTGYPASIGRPVVEALAGQGFAPRAAVYQDDVPDGRPAPWMIQSCMQRADVYPPANVVKVGDTRADVHAGRNAGAWSVGVTLSGSEVGLDERALASAGEERVATLERQAAERLRQAGAHATLRDLSELPALLATINARRARGEGPAVVPVEAPR